MQQDFIESHDIHAATAAKIFNIPVEEVTQDMRRKAKSINFGISYGMSAFGLSEQLKISIAEAKFIIESYFQNYPKIKEYMGKSINFAQANGFVQTLCGRKRFLPDIQNSNKNIRDAAERNAINMPIQGSSADMIKIAMIDIFKDFKKRNLKSKMILQVHDELVFDVIMEEKDIVNQIVIEKMQNALKLNIPIVVNTAFAENWLDAH
jgi:DNA polymerase-1